MKNFSFHFILTLFSVIDILDELKKEQREARDAIRWLENQFRLGNRYFELIGNISFVDCFAFGNIVCRFIRTQAVHERTTNQKKKTHKNKDFFRFQEIIDCCLYFVRQSNFDKHTTNSSMSTVNLLFARSLTNREQQLIEKDGKFLFFCFQKRQKTRIFFSSRNFRATY